ncbi:MAG: hypothetical protein K8L99_13665 [Anaerolineae bacterium]|nr:hypothetical protein [Anaerolineae bacterium]
MSDKTKEDLLATYLKAPPDEFIGNLVHDVRGPLSGVISAAKLIEVILEDVEINDREQLIELVEIIQRAAGNMRNVLEIAVEYDRIQRKSR